MLRTRWQAQGLLLYAPVRRMAAHGLKLPIMGRESHPRSKERFSSRFSQQKANLAPALVYPLFMRSPKGTAAGWISSRKPAGALNSECGFRGFAQKVGFRSETPLPLGEAAAHSAAGE